MTSTISTVDEAADRKFEEATAGVINWIVKELAKVPRENRELIVDYILFLRRQVNISDTYRKNLIQAYVDISKFFKNKVFLEITPEDILSCLDSLRRTDEADPLHKWIGTYNLRRGYLVRFFRWLQRAEVVADIPMLKRKEQSVYAPSDLWTKSDDVLFLTYCPDKRDRAYHAVSRDTSCRPSELLKLRIGDLKFKVIKENQYAEILVNGKTGSRPIPLIDALPYLKEWLDVHPQRGNPRAFIFPSMAHQNFLRKMSSIGLNHVYRHYRTEYFPSLLKDPSIPPEDEAKLQDLLKKPWNPYIRRHSALTEKSLLLKEHVLKQHAGWSAKSNMHLRYLHYYGNESSKAILEACGFIERSERTDVPTTKNCPNCRTANAIDATFCMNDKCRLVLNLEAFTELKKREEEKEKRLDTMQEQFALTVAFMMETDPEKKAEISRKLIEKGYVPKSN